MVLSIAIFIWIFLINVSLNLVNLVMGITTILSGLLFRRLHISDGKNLRTQS